MLNPQHPVTSLALQHTLLGSGHFSRAQKAHVPVANRVGQWSFRKLNGNAKEAVGSLRGSKGAMEKDVSGISVKRNGQGWYRERFIWGMLER